MSGNVGERDGAGGEIDGEIGRRVVAAFVGPAAGWEAVLAPGAVYHSPIYGRLDGRDAIIAAVSRVDESLGRHRREAKHVIVDGPFIAIRYEVRGTHDREFHGIPATGGETETRGIVFFLVQDGQVVEGWNMLDHQRRIVQIGGGRAEAAQAVPSSGSDAACPPPTRAEMTALAREFFTRVWTRDAVPGGVVADDVIYHSPAGDSEPGAEALAARNEQWWTMFPDQRLRRGELLVAGDYAATWYTATATDRGGFYGNPPTGRQVVFDGHIMFRVACGRIVEIWSTLDMAAIHRQLAG